MTVNVLPEDRTRIMGILNVTPDSFSGDGLAHSLPDAIDRAMQMISDGADIIDIGGESTRPGAISISIGEELDRVVPVVAALRSRTAVAISVDTVRSGVAMEALAQGANMINDVSGLRSDPIIAQVAVDADAELVIMHMRGTPSTMTTLTDYRDLIGDIYRDLSGQIEFAESSGMARNRIIIDPGFGFAKTASQNLEVVRRLNEFQRLGCRILVGMSRKSTLGKVLGGVSVEDREFAHAAALALAIQGGASIVRVHDVRRAREAVLIADAVIRGNWNE